MWPREKLKILFLCTGNSCRSQMAEGWARARHANELEAISAGIEAHGLNPRAVQVMGEAGIDISGHHSKSLDELGPIEIDWVVTVCAHADARCPTWSGAARRYHVPFEDPPQLAQSSQDEEEALDHYRRVRDEIRNFVDRLPERLAEKID